jgi:hypothetical protein
LLVHPLAGTYDPKATVRSLTIGLKLWRKMGVSIMLSIMYMANGRADLSEHIVQHTGNNCIYLMEREPGSHGRHYWRLLTCVLWVMGVLGERVWHVKSRVGTRS